MKEILEFKGKFSAFISLGFNCSVASSLSKYGLRDCSSPFDWYVSDFRGVIDILKTDFSDFLKIENLEISKDDKKVFRDRKYGFLFNHEIQADFNAEYNIIKEKYMRRIDRFQKRKGSICYVRAIKDDKEVDYIMDHEDLIKEVIAKSNPNNIIIFVVVKTIAVPKSFSFIIYVLDDYMYMSLRTGLRGLFDSIPEFVNFCMEHYDSAKFKENELFDRQKENRFNELPFSREEIEQQAIEQMNKFAGRYYDNLKNMKSLIKSADARVRNTILIAECDFSKIKFSGEIDIYGAGWIGKFFYDKASEFLSFNCFIDRKSDNEHSEYHGIEIVNFNDYCPKPGQTIVVIPTYDFYEVEEQLLKRGGDSKKTINCISIEKFVKQGIDEDKWKNLEMI